MWWWRCCLILNYYIHPEIHFFLRLSTGTSEQILGFESGNDFMESYNLQGNVGVNSFPVQNLAATPQQSYYSYQQQQSQQQHHPQLQDSYTEYQF